MDGRTDGWRMRRVGAWVSEWVSLMDEREGEWRNMKGMTRKHEGKGVRLRKENERKVVI